MVTKQVCLIEVGMKKMITRTRKFFVAVAISATAAAAVAGATLSGETREAPTTAEICATAAWPNIPGECLEGAGDASVRMIGMGPEASRSNTAVAAIGLSERFEIAFE